MDGEYSSILASALGFLPSPNHPIRSRQHVGWNGHADLLRSFQIDPKLKLHRLFHRQAGSFGSFQDPVDAICDSPVGFVAIKPPLASAGVAADLSYLTLRLGIRSRAGATQHPNSLSLLVSFRA
jgi:hypothetical protein